MLKRCKNLEWMVERHLVPIEGGVWIDAYNKITGRGVSGTITVQMNPSNQRFVTELYEINRSDKDEK